MLITAPLRLPPVTHVVRPDLAMFIDILNTVEDPLIQLELMKKLTGQHNPFTLMGGGLFHLAFGAILTGSAFGQNK